MFLTAVLMAAYKGDGACSSPYQMIQEGEENTNLQATLQDLSLWLKYNDKDNDYEKYFQVCMENEVQWFYAGNNEFLHFRIPN